jgi:hypothetical protein
MGGKAMKGNMKRVLDYAQAVGQMIEEKFGQGVTVRLDEELDPHDEIVMIDEWIEIWPTEVTIKTIAGDREVPGYLLGIEVVQHNYPHEPDDVDFKEIAEYESAQKVVTEAFKIWFETWIENTIENFNTTQWLKEEGEA